MIYDKLLPYAALHEILRFLESDDAGTNWTNDVYNMLQVWIGPHNVPERFITIHQ